MPIFNNIGSDKDQLNKNVFNLWVLLWGVGPTGRRLWLCVRCYYSHARSARDTELSEKTLIVVTILMVFIWYHTDF